MFFRVLVLFLTLNAEIVGQATHVPSPQQLITFCSSDGTVTRLADAVPGLRIDGRNGTVLRWGSKEIDEDREIGEFEVLDGEHGIGTIQMSHLSADIWIAWDNDGRLFSITWSDGGAIGNFHVRVFEVAEHRLVELKKATGTAEADFKSRHFCQARGNNVTALRWYKGNLLLMTDVYPTGDCGADLGHTEGYLVHASDGRIIRHLSLAELKRFPGVCLQNEDKSS